MSYKTARLKADESTIRCNRRHIIYLRYKDYQSTLHPSQWKYLPRTLEITGYEPFARHVEAPVDVEVTAATFDDAFAHLPELLAAAMDARKKSLRDLLPNGIPMNEGVNTDARYDPMDLATATFQCKEDFAFLFGWDEIASHHCRGEQEGVLLTYNADLQPKTTAPLVEYNPFAAKEVKSVVGLVGLDFTTTTPADLDGKDLRFACDSYGGGWERYTKGYDWRNLVRFSSSQFFYDQHVTRCNRRLICCIWNLITQISA